MSGEGIGAETHWMTGAKQVRRGGACVPGREWEVQVQSS